MWRLATECQRGDVCVMPPSMDVKLPCVNPILIGCPAPKIQSSLWALQLTRGILEEVQPKRRSMNGPNI